MKLIVGLGNPGSKYSGTRHNIGYEVIDYLAAAPGAGSFRNLFQSAAAEVLEAGEKLLLMKPETFMNLSGRAVRGALDFYKLTTADAMVICDDINLPLGKLRVRANGSHGGQNGLRNIQEMLGTDQYPRLRIGVGQPGPGDAIDYVLGRFKPGERGAVDEAVAKAAASIMLWVRHGLPACMNAANGADKPPKPKKVRPPDDVGRLSPKKAVAKNENPPTSSGGVSS